ncbi:MAG: hypothetical protein HQK49_18240 [Oligoflexia bacterium]|nr:hypothetical protein [Oligoflexia bacterium]
MKHLLSVAFLLIATFQTPVAHAEGDGRAWGQLFSMLITPPIAALSTLFGAPRLAVTIPHPTTMWHKSEIVENFLKSENKTILDLTEYNVNASDLYWIINAIPESSRSQIRCYLLKEVPVNTVLAKKDMEEIEKLFNDPNFKLLSNAEKITKILKTVPRIASVFGKFSTDMTWFAAVLYTQGYFGVMMKPFRFVDKNTENLSKICNY